MTISSLATAGGTLVLAVATFSSVKSGNRSARAAERSLLAGLQPVLIPSREDDPTERLAFGDQHTLTVPGHGGAVEEGDGNIYLAIALRNGGTGLAVLHAWRARSHVPVAGEAAPEIDDFRRQNLDLYIPAGDTGYWQGALRDPDEPGYVEVLAAVRAQTPVMVDLLYSDYEGGQRTITRFVIAPWPEVDGERAYVIRYWNLDRDDPR
ncbi:MAG: hypothetical protein ACLP50_35740 [Solirubrobacteraceae bacterium]